VSGLLGQTLEFTRKEKRILMRELVRCRTRARAISSIRPCWCWRRYVSAFERSPALDQVKVVPHLTGSANSLLASRRNEASSSPLNVSSSRDSSATLN
jgi:hypothetical protein